MTASVVDADQTAAGEQALDSLSAGVVQVADALATVQALLRAGLVLDAPRARQVAVSALAACGAAARELRRLTAARPGSSDYRGLAWLTRRERQVASLVCDGLTNRQVASRMFISEKTVEVYLSRVFRKLHVGNRVGLVRVLWGGGGQP